MAKIKTVFAFVGILSCLASCSGDDSATPKANQSTVQGPPPSTFMSVDPSSTFAFRPNKLTATSDSCGAPTNVSIEITEESGSKKTSVLVSARGSSVAVGTVYRDLPPDSDPSVLTSLLVTDGDTATHIVGAPPDPNSVVAAAARFDSLGATTFSVAYALKTQAGKVLYGSAGGTITVDSSCPNGKAERRVGYDFGGGKHVCFIQPNAPVPAIGCVLSPIEKRFQDLCRAAGKNIVSCGPCSDYCSAPL